MNGSDRAAVATVAAWAAGRLAALVAVVSVPDADDAAEIGIALDDLDDLAAAIATAGRTETPAAVTAFLTAAGGLARRLGREGEADEAAAALLDVVNGLEPGTVTAASAAPAGASRPGQGVSAAVIGFVLGAAAVATLRRTFSARPDATAARSALSAAAGPAIETAGGVLGPEAGDALAGLVGTAVETLTRIAADRAPLVRVETGISLPSVVLAYRLYGDPERSTELVRRNKVATPAAMPVAFEALAP